MPAAGASGPGLAVRRGEVWWVDFDPTQGAEIRKIRPAVVVTADGLNRARRTVVVVPLSSGPQPHPPIVVATPSAGQRSVAVCDQLRAVDKRRLIRSDGRLSATDLASVEDGVRRVLVL
jgi:mRNA interferase MazF